MTCTCSYDELDHGGADASARRIHVAGRCVKCDCQAFTAVGSMRAMYQRACGSCKHEWQAPSDKGACPRCHSASTITHGLRNNGLKRV